MREIGEFDQEKLALRFWNYLNQEGIDSSLEEDDENNQWSVWVIDEDKLQVALNALKEFSENPDDTKYLVSNSSESPKTKNIQKKPQSRFKEYKLGEKWRQGGKTGTFTLSIIITTVAVFLLSGLGMNSEIVGKFYITEKLDGTLSEFLDGEVWRIITPIFLHGSKQHTYFFNLLHIAFNMYLLKEFGSQIESLKGAKFFLTFFILLAICSNLLQFWASGPLFGGMSGVNYGLFGYVWIKTKYDPGDGFHVDSTLSMWLFGWFLIGFIGILPIANWAHAGGLVVGLAWGYGSAYRWNRGKM